MNEGREGEGGAEEEEERIEEIGGVAAVGDVVAVLDEQIVVASTVPSVVQSTLAHSKMSGDT